MAATGALLLLMALSSVYIRRLPVTTSLVYLLIGVAVGPAGLGWLAIDLTSEATWFERLTEIAVIASLFVSGLTLRLPLWHAAWRAPIRLAGPAMLLTIVGVAAVLHLALGWSPAVAVLTAAALAPTDPVLAGEVAVSEAADEDRMRYGLSGEAGLNDGMAFPFVVFGLWWLNAGALGEWVWGWTLSRLLWAVPAGLLVGYGCGFLIGRLGIALRQREQDIHAPSDFLCLALIALSYTGAESIQGWGFLSVFAAGVGMRHAERRIVQENPHPEVARPPGEPAQDHPPAEDLVPRQPTESDLETPAVAAGMLVSESLIFGDTLERLLEVVLVVLVGVLLPAHASVAGAVVAGLLFFVVRPLAVSAALLGSGLSRMHRLMLCWFGIRGIGSLYYLSYALTHGLSGDQARDAIGVVVTVAAASIVLHGMTAQPLVARYERALTRPARPGDSRLGVRSAGLRAQEVEPDA